MSGRKVALIVATLLIASLAENWRLFGLLIRASEPVLFLVCATWSALFLGSIVGLLQRQRWGAVLLVVLAPFSTLFLATPLLPGMHLVGLKGPVALAALNFLMLAAGIYLVRVLGRTSSQQNAA